MKLNQIIESNGNPFDEVNPEIEFVPFESLQEKEITIHATKAFENEKGPGVWILADIDGRLAYTCTHSTGVVGLLARDDVLKAVDEPEGVTCTVSKRPSRSNPGRFVTVLI